MKKIIIKIVLITTFISILAVLYFKNYLDSKISHSTIFLVKKNSSLNQIVLSLKEDKIIKNPALFKKILKIKTKKKSISYGEYSFLDSDSHLDIINKMIDHKIYYRSITFYEGLSNKSIFNALEKNEFLFGEITNKESIPEGSLMPETYKYQYGDSRDSIINRMQNDMKQYINENWHKIKNPYIRTKQELVILASIIEKETNVPLERRLIASVFINRLKIGMRLQSDPTAIYGYAKGDTEKEKEIPRKILVRQSSIYNTYKIKGLPPAPICNPGKDSIMAVLEPIESDYLFFVATGNGRHNFSKDYEEHKKHISNLKKIYKKK